MKNKQPKEHLSEWEWETLVAAWRYYEYRHTIVGVTFPEDIVERFFNDKKKEYSDSVRWQIANQFAMIDHGLRGEEDWTPDEKNKGLSFGFESDIIPWLKFYRFCEGYVNGFTIVTTKDLTIKNATAEYKCFHVDYTDRFYSVEHYIKRPGVEVYLNKDSIISTKKEERNEYYK